MKNTNLKLIYILIISFVLGTNSMANEIEFSDFKNNFKYKLIESNQGNLSEGGQTPDSAINKANNVYYLLDNKSTMVQNIFSIDRSGLSRGTVNQDVWSGYHWPTKSGIVANRYWGQKDEWDEYFRKYQRKPTYSVVSSRGYNEELSPSEKYDLVLSDYNYTLTKKSWSEGQYYRDQFGRVPSWYGLCDGWASASYMEQRPRKYIDVVSADSSKIVRFYPEDIKALMSLLWAKSRPAISMVGLRCNVKDPKYRSRNPECFDINSGSFHLALINQIGISGRSFLFDSTTDEEVWNSPITAYSYEYVNLRKKRTEDDLEDAIIPLRKYKRDPYSQYRSFKTTHVLGVKVKVSYKKLLMPNRDKRNNSSNDRTGFREYFYDLELDSSGNIVGGEWHTKNHPDFIWGYAKNKLAWSYYDRSIDLREWRSPNQSLNQYNRSVAIQSSSKGIPSGKIIRRLLQWANNR